MKALASLVIIFLTASLSFGLPVPEPSPEPTPETPAELAYRYKRPVILLRPVYYPWWQWRPRPQYQPDQFDKRPDFSEKYPDYDQFLNGKKVIYFPDY
jgi:hypothetical protein